MANRTATFVLIEDRLGKSLTRYVGAARRNGRSWNTIARDLYTATGVEVTSETLRIWFYDHAAKGNPDALAESAGAA